MPEVPTEAGDDGATSEDEPQAAYEEVIWLSTLKAANRMGITTRTLYRFIDRGDLPAYRFGRVIRLRLSDVDRFVEQCKVEPGSLEHLYPEARLTELDDDPETVDDD
ncbi:MAG: helix-turn-helix domain-containing protein [Acidimicrobiaceae bacterium]|nr:helix-turn-helix domain-containing protein [Acidimicrobiaceae bacterium]